MGYFEFMQEKRRVVKGWRNKTNAELQKLCDPLWKALSKEEKDRYKNMKKRGKRAELDQHVKERQRQDKLEKELDIRSLRLARDQFLVKKKSKKKIVLLGMETPSTAYVAPERELLRVQEFLQKCERNRIDKLFIRKGLVGFTSFSKDGMMYRCLVLACDRKKATVRFIDYGNEEDVDVGEIHSLIGDLETLRPLCFKLNIPNVGLVKNSEKNKARVEKKLQVENLFVCLSETGVVTLFNDLIPITFNFKAKTEKNLMEIPKPSGEAGESKEVVVVGKPDLVVSVPEKNFDVNGNLGGDGGGGEVGLDAAESLAREDSVVKPEVEESENDALTDGNNTAQAASSSKTGDDDDDDATTGEEAASGEVLDIEESKIPTVLVEVDSTADVEDVEGNNNTQDELVEKLVSMLPGVVVEVEESGLLSDSAMELLEGLVAQLAPGQLQCVRAVVERSLLQVATQSSSGAQLILALLKRSSQAEKMQVLGELYQGETMVRVLSSFSGFQAMVWSLNVCSEEEIIALTSTRSVIINALAGANFAPLFLSAFVKKFPQASTDLLDEILAQFDVLKDSPAVMNFFMSLTTTEIGLTKVVGWICQKFSDIMEDEDKADYVIKVIGRLESQHSVLLETLWRSLVAQNLFLPLASSTVGCPLVAGMVEAVMSGRCGGEGLRPEVISVMAQHVDALCDTPEGIKILKCLS